MDFEHPEGHFALKIHLLCPETQFSQTPGGGGRPPPLTPWEICLWLFVSFYVFRANQRSNSPKTYWSSIQCDVCSKIFLKICFEIRWTKGCSLMYRVGPCNLILEANIEKLKEADDTKNGEARRWQANKLVGFFRREIRENLKIMASKSWRNCPLLIPAWWQRIFKAICRWKIWELHPMMPSKLKTFYHDVTTVAYIMSCVIITKVKKPRFPAKNTNWVR